MKDRKTKYIFLLLIVASIFSLTIAYAALNTILKINGNAEVVASNWDIYLDNVQLISGSATTSIPTITNKTTASFTTTLTNPGDYYMFTIDVVNNGSIDAMIDSIEKIPTLSETQAKYLNYIVEYQNGESINTKQLVEANSFVRLKVKVEFRKDLTILDLPTASETLNLSFTVKYTQADENETSSVPNSGKLVKVVSGDYDTIGSEICIDTECFYVISSTDNDVTMFSKYNLYVGNYCSSHLSSSCVPYGDEATGKQDSTMLGYVAGKTARNGTTSFSSDSKKGETYNDYNGSIVEGYVNSYRKYLNGEGVFINDARLISENELKKLGCVAENGSCKTSLYPWVYSTSYWTGSAVNTSNVWFVYNDSFYGNDVYSYDTIFGVRPVITIPKSQF